MLIWHRRPTRSHQAPDVVLGQVDGEHGESNRSGNAPSASSLFWPYTEALAGEDTVLVADSGNNRVMLWPLATAQS